MVGIGAREVAVADEFFGVVAASILEFFPVAYFFCSWVVVGSSKAWLFKFGMLFGIGRSSGKLGWLSGRIERDFLEKEGVFVLERGVLEEDRISGGEDELNHIYLGVSSLRGEEFEYLVQAETMLFW